MIPDIDSTCRFKNRRIVETLEDALVLLRFYSSSSFEENRLADAAEQLRFISENTLLRLLQDPKVQMWSLVDLTPLTERTKSEEAIGLAENLSEQINLIALGIAHLERRSFRASIKHLPKDTFIPGVGISFDCAKGLEAVEIVSEADGTFKVNGSHIIEKRWLSTSGFTLPVDDPLLKPPTLEGYDLAILDSAQINQWEKLLARIHPLVKASSRIDSLVSLFGSFILPLKASSDGNHLSVSFKHLPGIIYASWSQDDLEVLEAIVHEADHHCLFEIINENSLFTDDAVNLRAIFRSPWRKDPRPLSGLFFGLSAFVTVGVFLTELLNKELSKSDQTGNRAVLVLEQSLDAVSILSNIAVLTGRGKDLLEFNGMEAQKALEKLRSHSRFDSWQEESRERRTQEASHWKQTHGGENIAA